MNTNLSNEEIPQVQERFKSALAFENDEERLEFEADIIHMRFMEQVKQLMESKGMNRKELAEALSTTKGYVSQLFSGDKLLNVKLLAKLQRVFGVKFELAVISPSYKSAKDSQLFIAADSNPDYHKKNTC